MFKKSFIVFALSLCCVTTSSGITSWRGGYKLPERPKCCRCCCRKKAKSKPEKKSKPIKKIKVEAHRIGVTEEIKKPLTTNGWNTNSVAQVAMKIKSRTEMR